MKEIYFDNNATTAMDYRVCKSLISELKLTQNASSPHLIGRVARSKLAKARRKIANYLNATSEQIIFTSGGTEAVNLALRGLFATKSHALTSRAEHACVLNTMRSLYPEHLKDELDPGPTGSIKAAQIDNALKDTTKLIAVTAANNETGVVTDLLPIVSLAEKKGIDLVVDASCAFGKMRIEMHPGISALCIAGHKFHGPQGIGLICLGANTKVIPQITGGAQENGRRAGTENVAAICALAEAVEIAVEELDSNRENMFTVQRELWTALSERLPGIELNTPSFGLPNTLNIFFPGPPGHLLSALLDQRGLRISCGAACSSGLLSPSHVLLAMGYSALRAERSLRFSLSKFTTSTEVKSAVDLIVQTYQTLIDQ